MLETERYDSTGTMDRLGGNHVNLLWDKSSLVRLENSDRLQLAMTKLLCDRFRDCTDLHTNN